MVELDTIPRVTLRDLSEILSKGFSTERKQGLIFTLRDLRYQVIFDPNEYELTFTWRDEEGANRKQLIYLYGIESNLLKGSYVWYFICPVTGRHCRKLFTDGKGFVSRYAFKHTYSVCNESHKTRRMRKLLNTMETDEEIGEFMLGTLFSCMKHRKTAR